MGRCSCAWLLEGAKEGVIKTGMGKERGGARTAGWNR